MPIPAIQDVAVKLIERSADGAREREFAREVEMMRACSLDPNIVPFYGVVLTQEHMGLVAEYMQVCFGVVWGCGWHDGGVCGVMEGYDVGVGVGACVC